MGFYTNVTFSNDFWHNIAKNPDKLLAAISVMMNYGMNSPLGEMVDLRYDRYKHDRARECGVPQGVIVHKARHADEPQVIINTYGSHAIDAEELPTAIQMGWLDENPYNEKHAEAVARELNRLARSIRSEVREAKARHEERGYSQHPMYGTP